MHIVGAVPAALGDVKVYIYEVDVGAPYAGMLPEGVVTPTGSTTRALVRVCLPGQANGPGVYALSTLSRP